MVRAGNTATVPRWVPQREGWGNAPRPAVRRRVRRRLRLRPEARFVFSVCFFFAVAVLLLTRYAALYGLGHQLEAERERLEQLQAERQRLLVQAAALESLERIEREARREGYVEPSSLRLVSAPAPTQKGLASEGTGEAEAPRTAVVTLTGGVSGAEDDAASGAAEERADGWWIALLEAAREGWNRVAGAGSAVAGR